MASPTVFMQNIHLQAGIVLGPYQVKKDIPQMVIHMNDKTITRNFGRTICDPYTPDHALKWLRLDDAKLRYSIRSLDQDDILIGDARISNAGNLGYWLSPDFWNRGIMTRAVAAVICEAKAAGLGKITADVYTFNPPSGKVLIKNGFRYVGDGIDDRKRLAIWKYEHD
ncbi:hypothetical protein MMC13_000897 [Lambiella insularis]|nr:hypothetical protein [Lambiella insularis]